MKFFFLFKFSYNAYIDLPVRMFDSEHREVGLIFDSDVMDSIVDRFGKDVVTYTNDTTSFCVVVKIA